MPAVTSDSPRDLNDERRLRIGLEERLAAEIEKSALWRRRAEERKERIRELERQLGGPKGVRGWLRPLRRRAAPFPPVPEQPPGPLEDSRRRVPALPTVTVATLVDHPAIEPVVDEANRLDLRVVGEEAVARADLIVIHGGTWRATTREVREEIRSLLEGPRPPVLVWETEAAADDRITFADVEISSVPGTSSRFVAGSFRPHPPDRGTAESLQDFSLDIPPLGAVEAASTGVPIEPERFRTVDVASHSARRWAYRWHRPSRRLSEILSLAGVPHPDPDPTVAAILISNRPDLVGEALDRLGDQSWRPTEIVVGLHGFDDPGLVAPAPDIPLTVLSLDEGLTLGECLNRAISQSTADVFAKIDDDDYYGPRYLEDAVYDLYAGQALVAGKATVFAYLSGENRTVLRRPGAEHRSMTGIVGGNTMVFRRAFWEQFPFPHRPRFVDRIVLEAAVSAGIQLYSGSRFEFCAVRHGRDHTYGASESLFAAGAEDAWPGFDPAKCVVPDLEDILGQ